MQHITLRDYQQDALSAIEYAFKNDTKQLISMPTGSGKTVVFAEWIRRHSTKALIICPTVDLVEQTIQTCKKLCPHERVSGVIKGQYRGVSDILVISSACLRFDTPLEQLNNIKFSDIIFDEAHKSACQTYENFLRQYPHPHRLLGCTATPYRADRKPLMHIFGSLSFSIELVDLIEKGYLVDLHGYRVMTQDKISSSKIRQGDFSQTELRKLDNPSRNGLILDVYKKHCIGKKTLIFCVSVDHAITCASMLKNAGFKAQAVYGEMDRADRKTIIEGFETGAYDVLTNCQLLTEGFDEPSINALIMARPTASKGLYVQMLGRGTRLARGKTHCDVYDFTVDCRKHIDLGVSCGASETGCWRDGDSVSRLTRDYELQSLETTETTIERIDILASTITLPDMPYKHQLQQLPHIPQEVRETLSYEEASFAIWYEKLKVKYGVNP